MLSTLIALIVLGLVLLLWLDGARAREIATQIAIAVCERRDLQFLDGSVALVRMALRRTPQGLRWRRMFRFDVSVEGMGRHSCHVLLIGTTLETVDLGVLDDPQPAPPTAPKADSSGADNVVPFRRRR